MIKNIFKYVLATVTLLSVATVIPSCSGKENSKDKATGEDNDISLSLTDTACVRVYFLPEGAMESEKGVMRIDSLSDNFLSTKSVEFPEDSKTRHGLNFNNAVIGHFLIDDKDKVDSIISSQIALSGLPSDVKLLWGYDAIDGTDGSYYPLYAVMDKDHDEYGFGKYIADAKSYFDKEWDTWVVSVTLNDEGARIFAAMTRENIGKCLAIVINDKVWASPRVSYEIPNGRIEITANYDEETANILAGLFKASRNVSSTCNETVDSISTNQRTT